MSDVSAEILAALDAFQCQLDDLDAAINEAHQAASYAESEASGAEDNACNARRNAEEATEQLSEAMDSYNALNETLANLKLLLKAGPADPLQAELRKHKTQIQRLHKLKKDPDAIAEALKISPVTVKVALAALAST